MPHGLPNHLAPVRAARAFARACHAVALVALLAAILSLLTLQGANGSIFLWPSIGALVLVVGLLVLLDRSPGPLQAVLYLTVGGIALYAYAMASIYGAGTYTHTDTFLLTLPKVALIMVGAGSSAVGVFGWALGGYVIGEVAVTAAVLQLGGRFVPDATTTVALVIIGVLLFVSSASQHRSATAQPSLARAARDEQLADVRARIEARAAAILHDTILSDLAAIGAAPDGKLDERLLAQVSRDLEVLLGEEWLAEVDEEAADAPAGWNASELSAVVERHRAAGLPIETSGDLAAIARLTPERAQAVAQAVNQCLVNVEKHSGAGAADVVVHGSEGDVAIMVIDTGRGFVEKETRSDRMGLRWSVRRRIEAVGGSVMVWSMPGRGTSVVLRLPALTIAAPHSATTRERVSE